MKGLETAASLATAFGSQATTAASKLADAADKQQATDDADKKLASIQRAKDKGLTSAEDAQQHANEVLAQMNGNSPTSTTDDNTTTPKETKETIKVIDDEVKKGNITKDEGKKQVSHQVSSMKGSKPPEVKKGRPRGLAVRLLGLGQRALIGD